MRKAERTTSASCYALSPDRQPRAHLPPASATAGHHAGPPRSVGRPARGAVHAAARYTAPQAPLNRARARGRSPTSARGRPTDRGRRTSRFYSPTSPRHVAAENYETGPAGPTRLRPTASAAADAVCASRDQCAVGCGVVASCAARSQSHVLSALPPSVSSVDTRKCGHAVARAKWAPLAPATTLHDALPDISVHCTPYSMTKVLRKRNSKHEGGAGAWSGGRASIAVSVSVTVTCL